LLFFCTVDRIIGGPLPDDGTNYHPINSSQENPSGDQSFPFREYQNESSNYVVVDDMVINKDPTRAGLIDANWPNGIVPYTFAYTIAPNQRTQIQEAMKELSAVSCVKFRPMKKDDKYNIEFKNDPLGGGGCSSFVGWQNRKNQPIQLGSVCSKGNVIHEILHALGFFHEQTRDDRDDYVTINYQNIQPGFENNFKKDSELYPNAETGYFGVPYNYDSIMHYGKTYFSRNGQNTIDVKENPEVDNAPVGSPDNLGQRDFISEGDVTMLRAKYNCDAVEENENNPEEPTSNPEEGEAQEGEGETTEAEATKPTTKNPMCQYNPGLPMCKQ